MLAERGSIRAKQEIRLNQTREDINGQNEMDEGC